MHITIAILVLQCTLCFTIRVPVTWDDSAVIEPAKITADKPVHHEYFQYTANKPQFAIDVAKFHDVKSPEKHYESYPVQPHTGLIKPAFGKHELLNSKHQNYKQYQEYVKQENNRQVSPVSNYYEVYHPYKAEVPALQEIYKDPVLNKIRNDVRDSKNRLHKYETEAGESDVEEDEYLERPENIDKKKFPIQNSPVRYEVYKPQRRPIYYQPIPIHNQREQYLNQKLKHPWNQNYAKVTPMHYRPLKHHLHRLRQQHALTYDDERNEYPQVTPPEKYAEKPDGYDIYEKGKSNYNKIRNNFDESINEAILKNRPVANQNLEFKGEKDKNGNLQQEEETFVPIKNYAQVRKTETFKHLPKSAAFRDAQNLEEYQNAPRLREAVKSSKNQVVYSEEGYEDSAYDHGGEQKHASDHEGHGGFLKENENSRGKYKIPTVDIGFSDEGKTASRDQVLHGEKWNDKKTDAHAENDSEEYSEDQNDYSEKNDEEDITSAEYNDRNKRENENDDEIDENIKNVVESKDSLLEHDLAKREINVNASKPNLESILPNTEKITQHKEDESNFSSENILDKKYPYYFKDLKILNKNSPLRYAENLKLIPQKINDDIAFYNSRIALVCPEVETGVDPVPERFKNDEVSNDDNSNEEPANEEDTNFKNKRRLRGLGDKIDCLKAKYFGEDPLDSPFFKEDLINNPLPLTKPDSKIFSLTKETDHLRANKTNNSEKSTGPNKGIFDLFNKLYYDNNTFSKSPLFLKKYDSSGNIKNITKTGIVPASVTFDLNYNHNVNKENVTNPTLTLRKKRATTFMYEPYKVIKENQSQDLKKLTSNGNVSPLIKKLQTRQIIDKATSNNVKLYKDIGKNDRPPQTQDATFVDVSMDQRRGEPRYELETKNHKTIYKPVENRAAISVADYKKEILNGNDASNFSDLHNVRSISDRRSSNNKELLNKPYFDVSNYLPQTIVTQNIAASNKIETISQSTTIKPQIADSDNSDDYEEYDDEDGITSTTTTTSKRPGTKIRIRLTSTLKPESLEQTELPKLRLMTRFHTTSTTETPVREIKDDKYYNRDDNISSPKYREKKKKSTKSTLVTDTETYGDDDEDMREREIDAMIGVKQDMDEYTPMYEKEGKNKYRSKQHEKNTDDDNDDDDDDNDDSDEDDDEDEDEDEDEDDDEDESHDDESDEYHKNIKMQQGQFHKNPRDRHHKEFKQETTTSEPTKRTLIRTTEPASTTEVLNKMNEQRPTVFKKRIEIHKELPVDNQSPHRTHFTQDIKEVEVVKESKEPNKKILKNLEALELYKDDNLAKDINKLGGVEIFKGDLSLDSSPRHGGNYRSIKLENLHQDKTNSNSDVEASESEKKSSIQVETSTKNPRSRSDIIRARNVRNRNGKLVESISKDFSLSMPGENVKKLNQNRNENGRSAKFIEIQDENVDHPRKMHGGNFKTYDIRNNNRQMHGGNYRSAKIIQADKQDVAPVATTANGAPSRDRKHEAELLNNFARAVPELTTAPTFILDPSKRQYYYVD